MKWWSVHKGERVLIGADLDGHVGEGTEDMRKLWVGTVLRRRRRILKARL